MPNSRLLRYECDLLAQLDDRIAGSLDFLNKLSQQWVHLAGSTVVTEVLPAPDEPTMATRSPLNTSGNVLGKEWEPTDDRLTCSAAVAV